MKTNKIELSDSVKMQLSKMIRQYVNGEIEMQHLYLLVDVSKDLYLFETLRMCVSRISERELGDIDTIINSIQRDAYLQNLTNNYDCAVYLRKDVAGIWNHEQLMIELTPNSAFINSHI